MSGGIYILWYKSLLSKAMLLCFGLSILAVPAKLNHQIDDHDNIE